MLARRKVKWSALIRDEVGGKGVRVIEVHFFNLYVINCRSFIFSESFVAGLQGRSY